MKIVARQRKPAFGSQRGEAAGAVRKRQQAALGKQAPTSVTINPGSRGSRKPGMKKN